MRLKFSYIGKVFILILLLVLLFFVHMRGFMFHDEGYILQAAQRIVHGEVIYKDFFIAYTPFSPFITALGFVMFGESVLSARLIAMVFSFITVFCIYKLARNIYSPYLSLIPVLLFLIWGPMHINFSWPVVYAIAFGYLTCWMCMLLLQKKQSRYSVLSGVMTMFALLSKQNFGLALLLNMFLFFLCIKDMRKKSYIVYFIVGAGIPLLLFSMYMFASNSFGATIYNFYFFFFKKIVIEHYDWTPFIYKDQLYRMVGKTLFYLFPFIISAFALVVSYRKKSYYFFLSSFCLFYYAFGIWPVTDLVHLTSLLALTGFPLATAVVLSNNKIIKYFWVIIFCGLVALGIYSSLFRNYYRWETRLIGQTIYVNNKRVHVWVDGKYAVEIPDFINAIQKNSRPDDYIFVNNFAPTLYFISDRKNPTRFIYFSPNILGVEYQNEIIQNLKSKNVRLVLTHITSRKDTSLLMRAIHSQYKMIKTIHDYDFWIKS